MLRVYFTSLLLIALLVVSCSEKKKTAAETSGKKKDIPEHSEGLIPDKPIGYTSDFAQLYGHNEIYILDSIMGAHEKSTTNQVAIITLDLDSTKVPTLTAFDSLTAEQLVKKWGIGTKEKDNGVGIIIAPNLRMIRIQVGYGLEEKLTDAECQKIIDEIMVPSFKKGEMFIGTQKALEAVITEIK